MDTQPLSMRQSHTNLILYITGFDCGSKLDPSRTILFACSRRVIKFSVLDYRFVIVADGLYPIKVIHPQFRFGESLKIIHHKPHSLRKSFLITGKETS